MLVEIWSDIVCPWCAIGKRRFELALDGFEHRDEVEVVFRSFELDGRAPTHREGTMAEHLSRKYGMTIEEAERTNDRLEATAAADGVTIDFDRARPGNTFNAHRLLHLAAERGVQAEVKSAFLQAYFADGVAIGDPEALAVVAVDAGLDRHEVDEVLAGDRYGDQVRADEARAQHLQVTGVPYFLIDGRFALPGAQPVERFSQGLQRAWDKRSPHVADAKR